MLRLLEKSYPFCRGIFIHLINVFFCLYVCWVTFLNSLFGFTLNLLLWLFVSMLSKLQLCNVSVWILFVAKLCYQYTAVRVTAGWNCYLWYRYISIQTCLPLQEIILRNNKVPVLWFNIFEFAFVARAVFLWSFVCFDKFVRQISVPVLAHI